MKHLDRLFSFIAVVFYLALTVMLVFRFALLQKSFLQENCLQKGKTAEQLSISDEDAGKVIDFLLKQVKGKSGEDHLIIEIDQVKTEFFNQREIDHLADLSVLYQRLRRFSLGAVFLLSVSFFYLWRRRAGKSLARMFLFLETLLLAAGVLLGIWITKSPLTVINGMHRMFFKNSLWILNPATDRLIYFFPKTLFIQGAYRLFFWLAVMLILTTAGCIRELKRNRSASEQQIQQGSNHTGA